MSINFNDLNPEQLNIIPAYIVDRENSFSVSRNFIDQGSTYLDLINKISENHVQSMQYLLSQVDIFELQNYGLPQFYFIVILHAILAEGVLGSIDRSDILSITDLEVDEVISVDNFKKSTNNVFRFLSGQFQEEDYLKYSRLITDPNFYSFISLFLKPVGSCLESAVKERISDFTTLSSEYSLSGSELDCHEVSSSKLPVLSLEHILSCETGLKSVFGYPLVLTHFDYVTFNFALVVTLSTVYDYCFFMKFFMKNDQTVAELKTVYSDYLDLHLSLYPKNKSKKLQMISKIMNDYSEKLKAKEDLRLENEARQKKIKERNERRVLLKAAQKEALALKHAQDKEQARLDSIKRQELLAEQERLAEIQRNALMEQIAKDEENKALKDAEKAEEVYLENLHFVIEKKQEILEKIDYFVTQLTQINDSSLEVQSFKEEIYINLNNLKSSFIALDSIDLVTFEADFDLEINIDCSEEDCLEYIGMLDKQFEDLVF